MCWVPAGVSLDVPCEALAPVTEDNFEQLPYGLGEAECDWFEKHMKTASAEEKEAKVAEYRLRAEAGNAYGQALLGDCYFYGYGVAKDVKRMVELCTLSAEQGNAWGQHNLGVCFDRGRGVAVDKERAVDLYILAAEQSHIGAQHSLGEAFNVLSSIKPY